MLKTFVLALVLLLPIAPVVAAETPQQYCDRVIDNADKGKDQALAAGNLYLHGGWGGLKCVKVDHVRAVQYYAKAGATGRINDLLQELEYQVNAGQARAKIIMRRLEASGLIRIDRIEMR